MAQYKSQVQASLHYWQRKTKAFSHQDLPWLDERFANLRNSVEEGLKYDELWQDTAVVITQVFRFIEWRGYWLIWIPVLEKAVQRKEYLKSNDFVKLNIQLAEFYRLKRDFIASERYYQFVFKQAEMLQDDELLARSYSIRSQIHLAQNQLLEAERFALLALTHSDRLAEHEEVKCFILQTLGSIKRVMGESTAALSYTERAVAIRRELNEPIFLADTLNELARVYDGLGQFEMAHESIDEALTIINQTDHKYMKSLFLMNKGVFYYRQNYLEKAEEIFAQIDFFALKRQGRMVQCGLAMQNLGNVLFDQDKILEAEPYIQEAVQIFRSINDEIELANSLGTLAQILLAQDRQNESIQYFEEALTLLKKYPENAWARKLKASFQEGKNSIILVSD